MKKILICAAVLLALGFSQNSQAQGNSGGKKSSQHTVSQKHSNSGYKTGDDVIVTHTTRTYRTNNGYHPAKKPVQYRTRHDNGLHKGWYKGKHKGWYKKSRRPVKH
jgi:hypothetical protein